jgi:predicted DNA-binding transcriptional regulator YafY
MFRFFILNLSVNVCLIPVNLTVMNKFERACIKGRILQLARMRSTGTPEDLAYKFDISSRTIKRIIKELREEGEDIRYDYNCMSYIFPKN